MTKKIIFRNHKINLQADEDAVKFYPSLYSKVKRCNDQKKVISLDHISVDALKTLVNWINRHHHDKGHTENPVAVTLRNNDELVDDNGILEVVQISDEYDMIDLLDRACKIAAPIVENMDPIELKAKFFASGDSSKGEEGFLDSDDEL